MEGHSMRGEGCILRTRMVLLRDVFPSRNQITLWDKPTRRSEKYLVCLSHDQVKNTWFVSKPRLGVVLR